MKNANIKRFGFTLIELLVVILIIGILAAGALPQYKKAVEKARMTEAIMAVEKIAQAQDLYYMSNNTYTRDINDLDIGYDNLEDYNYYGIPAKKAKHFILAASNHSGDEQKRIAMVQRIPVLTKYALSINLDHTRRCYKYDDISDYEEKLCQAWRDGQN